MDKIFYTFFFSGSGLVVYLFPSSRRRRLFPADKISPLPVMVIAVMYRARTIGWEKREEGPPSSIVGFIISPHRSKKDGKKRVLSHMQIRSKPLSLNIPTLSLSLHRRKVRLKHVPCCCCCITGAVKPSNGGGTRPLIDLFMIGLSFSLWPSLLLPISLLFFPVGRKLICLSFSCLSFFFDRVLYGRRTRNPKWSKSGPAACWANCAKTSRKNAGRISSWASRARSRPCASSPIPIKRAKWGASIASDKPIR